MIGDMKPGASISPDELAALGAARFGRYWASRLAEAMGYSRAAVALWRKNGIADLRRAEEVRRLLTDGQLPSQPARPSRNQFSRKRLTSNELRAAAEMLSAGASLNATAKALACDTRSLRHWQKRGLLPASTHRRPPAVGVEVASEAAKLAAAGATRDEIAERLGTSPRTIRRLLGPAIGRARKPRLISR